MSFLVVLALPWASACGGGTPAPAAPAPASNAPAPAEPREIATGAQPTRFQRSRLLGHYSTLDGASGFILDRTGSEVRAKLDRTADVKVLTAHGGPHQTKEYESADGDLWLRIDPRGEVLLFQGPSQTQGVEVTRDADAEPLQ
jgi:hypothetical protein